MATEAVERGQDAPPGFGDSFEHVFEPTRGLGALRLRELVSFRELLYKQAALGVIWAILQPVLAMILFSVIFSDVAHISSQGVPYPIFSYCALVPWLFFANSVQLSSMSLTLNPNLITKVYFPRVFVVASPILASLLDLALASIILVGLIHPLALHVPQPGRSLLSTQTQGSRRQQRCRRAHGLSGPRRTRMKYSVE